MATVKQPTKSPTNKLSSAVLAAAMMEIGSVIMQNSFPDYWNYDIKVALTPIVIWMVGYYVSDAPNA